MAASAASTTALSTKGDSRVSTRYWEGIVAGLIGAATLAVWYFILDVIWARPLYTPAILGTLVFQGPQAIASPETVRVSLESVFAFTWIHALVMCAIGGMAAWLLALAEEKPEFGFGIVLLMVFFEFAFITICMVVAEPLLRALTWPAILVGNLLAILTMGGYFWRRHPNLSILP